MTRDIAKGRDETAPTKGFLSQELNSMAGQGASPAGVSPEEIATYDGFPVYREKDPKEGIIYYTKPKDNALENRHVIPPEDYPAIDAQIAQDKVVVPLPFSWRDSDLNRNSQLLATAVRMEVLEREELRKKSKDNALNITQTQETGLKGAFSHGAGSPSAAPGQKPHHPTPSPATTQGWTNE